MITVTKSLIALAVLLVVACSGGGSSSSSTFFLEGTVTIQSNINTDSDNNDPNTVNVSNSTILNAQSISNITNLNGFVTATTIPGGAFSAQADQDDFYSTFLQEGQEIRLDIVDFDENTINLDLFLLDTNGNVIRSSVSVNSSSEVVTIPTSDDYLVNVKALNGFAKYLLTINGISNINSINAGAMQDISVENMISGEIIVKYKNDGDVLSDDGLFDNLLYKDLEIPQLEKIDISDPSALSHFELLTAQFSHSDLALRQFNRDSFEKIQTLKKMSEVQSHEAVEIVSPNFIRRIQRIPDDTEFDDNQENLNVMNLPNAWDITVGDAVDDVIIAVVDTGVYSNHIDLKNKLIDGYDFVSSVANSLDGDGIDPNPEDPGDSPNVNESSWHGSHVAGIAAAESDNNEGIAGVSWGAKIMPLRACGAQSICDTSDIIQAVRYAAGLNNSSGTIPDEPADIINLSFGGSGFSPVEDALFQQISDLGIIVVASAGNDESTELNYPASYDDVFSIGAIDNSKALTFFSNYGVTLDLVAPGRLVLSTIVNEDENTGVQSSDYAFYSGTSMSAPHVAGVLALMKAVYPDLTPEDFRALINSGTITEDLGDEGRDDFYGYGLLDADLAVQAAVSLDNGDPLPQAANISPRYIDLGTANTSYFVLENIGGGNPVVSSINEDESWLNIVGTSVDGNGFGTYQVDVIGRSGLSDGFYATEVEFEFVSGLKQNIPILMTNGEVSTIGQTANLIVYLSQFDESENFQTVQFLGSVESQGNGVFSYRFDNIPEGSYEIAASTNIDFNTLLCTEGEACGVYPRLGFPENFYLNSNYTNVNFEVELVK